MIVCCEKVRWKIYGWCDDGYSNICSLPPDMTPETPEFPLTSVVPSAPPLLSAVLLSVTLQKSHPHQTLFRLLSSAGWQPASPSLPRWGPRGR